MSACLRETSCILCKERKCADIENDEDYIMKWLEGGKDEKEGNETIKWKYNHGIKKREDILCWPLKKYVCISYPTKRGYRLTQSQSHILSMYGRNFLLEFDDLPDVESPSILLHPFPGHSKPTQSIINQITILHLTSSFLFPFPTFHMSISLSPNIPYSS